MPTYDIKCTKCDHFTSYRGSVKDYDIIKSGKILCDKCHEPMEQYIGTPPSFAIGACHTYNGITKVSGGSGKKPESDVPINIIDEKPDGSYRVTRIGKKSDIDND